MTCRALADCFAFVDNPLIMSEVRHGFHSALLQASIYGLRYTPYEL